MDVKDLLKNFSAFSERETVEAILSNRISHFVPDINSAVIALNNNENMGQLVSDLIYWKNTKSLNTSED